MDLSAFWRRRETASARTGRLRTREMRPTDHGALTEVFDELSAVSRYQRFHTSTPRMTAVMQRRLLDLDGIRHRALLAEAREKDRWRPVGIARYLLTGATQAEVAIEVVDEWQGREVGLLLLRQLCGEARHAGVDRLVGSVLPDNRRLAGLLREHFPQRAISMRDGTMNVALATG
jgi:GNAT superfamily N-acetyltransferase